MSPGRFQPLLREDVTLLPGCRIANGFFTRFLGLMGRKQVAEDEALVFPNCTSIHTFFMRIPIDVILVDSRGTVVDVVASMAPWRLLMPRPHVAHIIEMRAGRAAELGITTGNQLACEGAWE